MRTICSLLVISAIVLNHFWHPKPKFQESRGQYLRETQAIPRAAPIWDVAGAVDAYVRKPTDDRASAAWEAFGELDSRIAELKQRAALTVGGFRAEAEVDRIDLEHLRDGQLPRFLSARSRWKSAQAAFDALAASADAKKGVENAAAVLVHGGKRDFDGANHPLARP